MLSQLARALGAAAAGAAEAYGATAVAMASDRAALRAARRLLRRQMAATVADASAFMGRLETLYRLQWRHWCARRNAHSPSAGANHGGGGPLQPPPQPPSPMDWLALDATANRPSVAVSYEHSANLPALLECLALSVLLSTYQAGRVVSLGCCGGELRVGFSRFDQAMGHCRTPTGPAVGSRDAIWSLPASREIAPRITP